MANLRESIRTMFAHFRKPHSEKANQTEIDPETGYPQQHMDILNEMMRGQRPGQIVITNVDDDGVAHTRLVSEES
jgi:hypothetical protein